MKLEECLKLNKYKHYDIIYNNEIVAMEYSYVKPSFLNMEVKGIQMHEDTSYLKDPHYSIFIGD